MACCSPLMTLALIGFRALPRLESTLLSATALLNPALLAAPPPLSARPLLPLYPHVVVLCEPGFSIVLARDRRLANATVRLQRQRPLALQDLPIGLGYLGGVMRHTWLPHLTQKIVVVLGVRCKGVKPA